MIEEFATSSGSRPDELTSEELTAAEELTVTKYATDDWTHTIP